MSTGPKLPFNNSPIFTLTSVKPHLPQRTIDRITRRSQQIATFPNSGRVVSEFDNDRIREIIEGKYRTNWNAGMIPKGGFRQR